MKIRPLKSEVKMPRRMLDLLESKKGHEAYTDSKEVAAICKAIAWARKKNKLSQEQLAELSGVPQAELSRIESGLLSRGPTLLTLVRLARAMGLQLRVQFEMRQSAHPGVLEIIGHVTTTQDVKAEAMPIAIR